MGSSLDGGVGECGEVGAGVSYFQSQMHSEYDSAESIADSNPEDGELRKCWLYHCICRIDKTMNPLECESLRGDLLHCYWREEEQVQNVLKLI